MFAAVIFLFFSACQAYEAGVEDGVIQRLDLFSLDIGPMEDQIAFFPVNAGRGYNQVGITMRDGFLYIADGNGGKIVRYNSFGDLLFMIFNEETNPRPIRLQTNSGETRHASRWASPFPLSQPHRIVVDSRRHLFVEDRLPRERMIFDTENNIVLDGLILHFDQDGQLVQYLGQGGVGGSPFPRIVGLYASVMDEIVVISRLPQGWRVFWFDPSGTLLYLVKIDSDAIPQLPGLPSALASVDRIAAAPDARKLLIKVDYYHDVFENNARIGKELGASVIWTLDVESGYYTGFTEVPLFAFGADMPLADAPAGAHGGGDMPFPVIYSMLGVMRNGVVLLYFPVDAGYSLLFLDTSTGQAHRGLINFSNELAFSNFSLSAEGMLVAVLIDEIEVNLVGWRTDLFITRELL